MILHKVFSNNTYIDHMGINIICFYIDSLIFLLKMYIANKTLFLLQIAEQREKNVFFFILSVVII